MIDCHSLVRAVINNNALDGEETGVLCETLSGIGDTSADTAAGVFPSRYAIGKIINAVKNNTGGQRNMAARLKEYGVVYGATKIKEFNAVFKLGNEFPRLLRVHRGFNSFELRTSLGHIRDVCALDAAFWSSQ